MIAALFVQAGGVYFGLPGVDPWDESRDARLYTGPHPVVAHPPCARWGRYAEGGPSAKTPRRIGADDGCFEAALGAVRTFGGVLEHPEASHAFGYYGITRPPFGGEWVRNLSFEGWVCCVHQGHYGHRANKATWLLAVGCELPALTWGRSKGKAKLEDGFHSAEERRSSSRAPAKRLSARERLATPLPFRNILLDMALSVVPGGAS